MCVHGKENSGAPAAKGSEMVGMQKACPVLFWVMSILGFVLPKRRPSGHYRTSWVRLFPMMTITPLTFWYVFNYQTQFTDNSYDQVADLLAYSTCTFTIAFTFALAIHKRRETCILLEGLDGKLKPPRTWLSLAGVLLFLLDFGLLLLFNYFFVASGNFSILKWFTMTLIYPALPLLVDFYIASSICALNQVYDGIMDKILRRSKFSAWTLGSVEEFYAFSSPVSSGFFDKFQVSDLQST